MLKYLLAKIKFLLRGFRVGQTVMVSVDEYDDTYKGEVKATIVSVDPKYQTVVVRIQGDDKPYPFAEEYVRKLE